MKPETPDGFDRRYQTIWSELVTRTQPDAWWLVSGFLSGYCAALVRAERLRETISALDPGCARHAELTDLLRGEEEIAAYLADTMRL